MAKAIFSNLVQGQTLELDKLSKLEIKHILTSRGGFFKETISPMVTGINSVKNKKGQFHYELSMSDGTKYWVKIWVVLSTAQGLQVNVEEV